MEDAPAMESAEEMFNELFDDDAQFSASNRFAFSRPTIRAQVDSLGPDLTILEGMIKRGLPHALEVILAVVRAALVLAVTQPTDEDERFVRVDILSDVVMALERVGLGHFKALVMAALDRDGDATVVARGPDFPSDHRGFMD